MKPLYLLILLCLCVTVVRADTLPTPDWGGFGNLELRWVKPIAPMTLDVGVAGACQLFTWPRDWIAIGGRKMFADVIYTTQNVLYLGGSISLKPADSDDGLRGGFALSTTNPTHDYIISVQKYQAFNW
jgi:hypothetical protein